MNAIRRSYLLASLGQLGLALVGSAEQREVSSAGTSQVPNGNGPPPAPVPLEALVHRVFARGAGLEAGLDIPVANLILFPHRIRVREVRRSFVEDAEYRKFYSEKSKQRLLDTYATVDAGHAVIPVLYTTTIDSSGYDGLAFGDGNALSTSRKVGIAMANYHRLDTLCHEICHILLAAGRPCGEHCDHSSDQMNLMCDGDHRRVPQAEFEFSLPPDDRPDQLNRSQVRQIRTSPYLRRVGLGSGGSDDGRV